MLLDVAYCLSAFDFPKTAQFDAAYQLLVSDQIYYNVAQSCWNKKQYEYRISIELLITIKVITVVKNMFYPSPLHFDLIVRWIASPFYF